MARGGGEGKEPLSFSPMTRAFSPMTRAAAHEQSAWRPVRLGREGLTR